MLITSGPRIPYWCYQTEHGSYSRQRREQEVSKEYIRSEGKTCWLRSQSKSY